jgi:predicted TIM-barrel fold metal-dependent hydrolase
MSSVSPFDFPVFDADNHLYETTDALTKYLPPEYKGAIDYVDIHGRTKIMVRGQISDYIPNPTFERVGRPGAQEEYFKQGNPEGKTYREIIGRGIDCPPAFREASARLELLDEQGIDFAIMLPTLASLIEERMRDDPDMIHVVVHSLNQWLFEEWGFNHKDRVYTTPVLSLPDVNKALAELDWVLERGARAILVRPAPVPGYRGPRSFALPEFDPFWKRVEEAGVLVAMHSSDSGYARYTSEWEGGKNEMLPFKPNAFRMVGEWRPIQDAVASWVCHGALFRFPNLKVALIENGAAWVSPLLDTIADIYKKSPQDFDGNPVEEIKKRIHISPFYEDDLSGLIDLVGVERVLFGSDYPHPEGLAEPTSYIDGLGSLDEVGKAKVMGGNLAQLIDA